MTDFAVGVFASAYGCNVSAPDVRGAVREREDVGRSVLRSMTRITLMT